MHKLLLLIILLVPIWLFSSPFTLENENQDALTVRFNLPEYHLEPISIDGSTWQRINCEEGLVHGEEGYPELRVFSVPIAIPVDGDISYVITAKKSSIMSNVKLKPISAITLGGDEPLNRANANFKAYRNPELYPLQIISKGEAAFVGNRRFVSLMVFPFQYNAQKEELTINSEISIEVYITGNKSQTKNWQSAANPLDTAKPPFFLNDQSSKAWRLEKSRATDYQSPKYRQNTVSEIQLIVDTEGIYKVGYQYLMDYITMMVDSLQIEMAWTPASVDPRYLELSDEYGQVPIHFYGENDGSFDPGDYFEFYGDRHKGDLEYTDDYTAENVYSLKLVDNYGARMAVENGGLIESDQDNYIVPDAYEDTVHLEQQLISDKLGRGWTSANPNFYREDVWFWKKINAPDLEIVPFQLQYPKVTTVRTASAKVSLMGLTYSDILGPNEYDHEASIRLNQAMINTHSWIGQTEKIFHNATPIPNNFLFHGTNNLFISLSGNTVMGDREQVLLDYADITYWREYRTDQDYMKFTKPSNRPSGLYQFELQGFSSNNVSVYKIGSSIFNNLQIEPFNLEGVAPWTVTLQDSVSSNAVRYYAVSEANKRIPKDLRLNISSDLKNPNNYADIIVIGYHSLINTEGTALLQDIWESAGYQVKIVDVQDIYDEFNSGIVASEPIRDFLRYAWNNWSEPELKHVLLLGEGVDDTRDNSPSRIYNLIPVKKTWTYKHGATASDNWYGCIIGNDIVPDFSISRLSAWQPEQVLDYALKAESYHHNPQTSRLWNSHLTFTSGGKITDTNDIFAQQSERIRRQSVPPEYRVTRVYTATQDVSHEYFGGTFDLKDAINSGTQYVQFMGHGGGRIWADYNLFNFNDVATLNNQTYPIVLSLACYASAFDTNGMASISEALVLQPEKGSIGSVGFTGLGYLDQDEGWGQAYTEALFSQDFPNVGTAMTYTLARFFTSTSSDAARYALINAASYLGDPLIKLRKPITGIPVSAENYTLAPGDTLRVQAQFPAGVSAARLYIMKQTESIVNVPYDLPVDPDGSYHASYALNDSLNSITRRIYVAGYSSTDEYIGTSMFSVGKPVVDHFAINPAEPVWTDSVAFSARVFSPDPVINLICRVITDSIGTNIVWVDLPMQPSPADSTIYISTSKLAPQASGKELRYKYVLNTADNSAESFMHSYVVRGPDLFLNELKLEQAGQHLVLKVRGTNIGNASSLNTDLRLYQGASPATITLFSTQNYPALNVGEIRWDSIDLTGLESNNLYLEVRVNYSDSFPELDLPFKPNNVISMRVPFNYQLVDANGASITSNDNNLQCDIPANLVPAGEQALFSLQALSPLLPLNQPDVCNVRLRSADSISGNIESVPYEISVLNSELTDSLGVLANGKRFTLTFFYNPPADSLPPEQDNSNTYKIYRYNSTFQKWILQGGYRNASAHNVSFEVNRVGIYSLFSNTDTTVPTIEVNVQDQEFTVGGYIAGDGVMSLILSDANGIDVIDNSIKLFLNGVPVPEEEYVISVNLENINRIPIKYQLNLERGNHELKVDCRDLNGYYNTREIKFVVNDHFDVINLANYPNPIIGKALDPKYDGRTRFTYVLTDDADEVKIKVYTISGRLVKTFAHLPAGVGYHEYPRTVYGWDCKDEWGYSMANGVYFYRIIASKGGKTIEKTQKMAILK